MSRKIIYLAAAGFLLFSAAGLPAQDAPELRLGSSLSATLREGGEQWYSVRVPEECFVVVETTGSVDTYLEVYGASNSRIAENDDGGEDLNAKVEFYASPGMAYRLRLSGYGGYGSGPYRIWASQKPLPQPVQLRVGAQLSGSLAEGGESWYSVTPSGAGFLVVETFSNMDTYLEAYGPSFSFIAGDDDSGEDNNARLELPIEAGRTYLFKLRGYGSYESGPYTVRAGTAPPPRELRVGASLSGNLAGGESSWYSVTPSGAGLVVIEASGGMDTFLEVYGPSFNFIANDDDSGENNNARLELFMEAGKTYLVRLRGYDSYESGPYTVRAGAAPPPQELRAGASHSGNLAGGQSNWYSITPSGGGLLTLETSSGIDTFLEVYDTSNTLIGYDDDGGEDNNARLELYVDAGKTYLVRVRGWGYGSYESGPYRLWVSFENAR